MFAMAKVEVQIRSCFCCGLSIGSVFVGIYTLFLYALLLGLAWWAIVDTTSNGDKSYYTSCELEAEGRSSAENRKLTFVQGHAVVVIEDSTSYHCSFGLYTEELKFTAGIRYPVLLFDMILYGLIILASIILLVGLCTYNQWFLVPWILLMSVDIIRGVISTVLIFVFSHGNLARIATGIFFLGLQCFHISILLIIIAKFQRVYNRNHGIPVDTDRHYDPRAVYPSNTLPSTYAYSPQQLRRDRGDPYPYSDYSPSQKDGHIPQGPRSYYDGTYGSTVAPPPSQQHHQQGHRY